MQNLLVIFTLFIGLGASNPTSTITPIDLKIAGKENIVSYQILGDSESTHYEQPIVISIQNLKDEKVYIRIPLAQQFLSENKEHQDLILVKEELIALKPFETQKHHLNAMCIQQANSAPQTGSIYNLGNIATGPIKLLSEEIQKREAFNTIGQYAVWNLTNDYGLSNITGFDEAEATHFREYVAHQLGVDPPKLQEVENYNAPAEESQKLAGHIIGGDFNYGFTKTSDVTIGMFNSRNVIVRELLNQPATPPGKHHFSFQFDTMEYTEKEYYIRLIINGRVKVNYKMRRDG